jgi:NADP-reducing hydrogenase subunit HndB
MAIKSLEELRALRASLKDSVNLREKGESTTGTIEVLVGMGTCGISAGARETFNKLLEVVEEKGLNNVKVISVGCIGQCSLEPTVQVNIPNREPLIYGEITKDKVEEMVQTVIIENGYLKDGQLIPSFLKAEVK